MKRLIFIAVLVLVGCDNRHIPTYEELRNYRTSCTNEQAQLSELRHIQSVKNFAEDPDQLNEEDRAYNSRLKATIWWYALECHREKNSTTVSTDH